MRRGAGSTIALAIIAIGAIGAVFTVVTDTWVFASTRTPADKFARGHWITGTVKTPAGQPVKDVLLAWTGSYKLGNTEGVYNGWTITDANGTYRIMVPHLWSGTVTPQTEGLDVQINQPSTTGTMIQRGDPSPI